MLLFSTVLDIDSRMSKTDFWNLINEWNRSNQYHPENIIPDLNWQGESNFKFGSEDLWLAAEEYEKASTYAVRYEKRQSNGSIWDTDYVFNRRNMTLSIRLERSYTEEAIRKDQRFSAPYFVELLIDKGFLKKDNNLPLTYEPICVEDDLIDILGSVINETSSYKYPIVYVSKTLRDEDPVDVKRLARKLRGIAHVLVEKSYSQNDAIRNACDSKHEYNGAVGIYYPNKMFEHKRFVYRRAEGQDSNIFDMVVDSILLFSNSQLVDPLMTWQGVNNALLRDRLSAQNTYLEAAESARKKSEEELNKLSETVDDESRRLSEEIIKKAQEEYAMYMSMADEENADLEKKIQDLTKDNEDLRRDNQRLDAKLRSISRIPILYFGDEYELFDDEIKDLILMTLDEVARELPDDCRKKHVFEDIVRNNNYQKICKTRADQVRNTVGSYNGMTPKMRSFFESIGFDIQEGGKHYKMFYYGDQRYVKTMSKTPSDWRVGERIGHDIIGLLY